MNLGPQRSPDSPGAMWKRSNFLQLCCAEREEILRHKWLRSEQVGHDIGYHAAVMDWVRRYRRGWLRHQRPVYYPAQS